jgi:hypothetical protein
MKLISSGHERFKLHVHLFCHFSAIGLPLQVAGWKRQRRMVLGVFLPLSWRELEPFRASARTNNMLQIAHGVDGFAGRKVQVENKQVMAMAKTPSLGAARSSTLCPATRLERDGIERSSKAGVLRRKCRSGTSCGMLGSITGRLGGMREAELLNRQPAG